MPPPPPPPAARPAVVTWKGRQRPFTSQVHCHLGRPLCPSPSPSQRPPCLPFPGSAGRRQPFPHRPTDGGGSSCGPDAQSPRGGHPAGWREGAVPSTTLAWRALLCHGPPPPEPARASSWAGSRPLPQPLPAVFGVGLGSWRTAAGRGGGRPCNCRKHPYA